MSCFIANLKGFLGNYKQFTNAVSFQHARTSVFFFFSTPGRLFGSKNERRTHFLRACPVKIKYCFGCVPEETLQTTEKRSPFPGKIIVICCFYWSIKLQANSDQCVFFSLTHCKPTRLCFRSIGNELFSFDPAVYFRRMIMNGGDFYTGRALSKNYRTPFCGVFCSRCCLFFPCLKCPL